MVTRIYRCNRCHNDILSMTEEWPGCKGLLRSHPAPIGSLNVRGRLFIGLSHAALRSRILWGLGACAFHHEYVHTCTFVPVQSVISSFSSGSALSSSCHFCESRILETYSGKLHQLLFLLLESFPSRIQFESTGWRASGLRTSTLLSQPWHHSIGNAVSPRMCQKSRAVSESLIGIRACPRHIASM